MKRYLVMFCVLTCAALQVANAQSVVHPWHVVDNGGGKSSAGGIFLHGSIGLPAVAMMSSGGVTLEGGYIPGIRFLGGTTSELDFSNEAGWNLVSLPLIVGDPRKSVLYPGGTSAAFAYLGAYQPKDTMNNGLGYWIKFPSPASVHFTGTTIQKETVQVRNNWNLVGAMSYPTLVAGIVPLDTTSFVSNFYGYKSSGGYYLEDTLKPGIGYWVKVHNPGRIIVTTGSVVMDPSVAARGTKDGKKEVDGTIAEKRGTLTIRDASGMHRELYVASAISSAELDRWELPPALEGMMDARFASNRMLESAEEEKSKEVGIVVAAAEYPLTLSWKVNDELKGAKLRIDEKEVVVSGSGEARIQNAASNIRFAFAPAKGKDLPKEFALYQNYPNPFNPSTTIRYDLPKDAHVRVVIYDALGREVKELIAGDQEAGYQTVVWEGKNARGNTVASGMYFYRIEARPLLQGSGFTEVRKMVVVK